MKRFRRVVFWPLVGEKIRVKNRDCFYRYTNSMSSKEKRLWVLQNQVRRLNGRLTHLRTLNDRYVQVRLVTFLLGCLVSFAVLWQGNWWAWLGATAVAFVPFAWSVALHRRLETSLHHHETWLWLKQTHIARMTLDWQHIPPSFATFPPADHPFAFDLDIAGERSLHQLMDTAVSQEASQRLLNWLLDPCPDAQTIGQRQTQVRELTRLPRFRDKLTLHAALTRAKPGEKWPGQQLLNWLQQETAVPPTIPTLLLLTGLAVLNLFLWWMNSTGQLPPWWGFTWGVYALLSLTLGRTAGTLLQDALFIEDSLRRLGRVFTFLEQYPYGRSPQLQTLCTPFLAAERPSTHLKRINQLLAGVGLRQNSILWFFINALIPWDLYFAYRLHQSRHALKQLLPLWLNTWFELESISSLATFAYLNPDYTFPTLTADSPHLVAQQLGHPLLPTNQKVCNDFAAHRAGQVYLVTGSNMSGKSSFLRTIGMNLCLAYAGSAVNAGSLHLSWFRLFTSMRLTDSLADGISFFYAEVRRLKRLLDELTTTRETERPLLFLIDEIFRGTNNRERLLGSREYIRALAGSPGLGFVATHDLELVQLAEEISEVCNYHFRDDVVNGRMHFDYKLHPGPCPTTNALKIMQLAGLPIPPHNLNNHEPKHLRAPHQPGSN